MVGNLELCAVLGGVVIDVSIASFRKSMVNWLRRGIIEVVVDIGEAAID